MAIIIKALGAGSITITGTIDLYTVPTNRSAIVSNVRVVNATTSTTPLLNLYVKPSGSTARRIAKKDFTIAVGSMLLIEDVLTVGQGDKIQIDVPPPGATHNLAYVVSGVERE